MNITESRLLSAICVIFAAITLSCCGGHHKDDAVKQTAVDTIPVLATRVASCSRLYTSEYQLRKILIYDDPAALSGKLFHRNFKVNLPFGKRRIAIPVTATAKAYVDLSKIGKDNIRRTGDKLEIILPDPEVTLTSTRIDHNGVKQKVALLRSNFTDEEITHIQQQGRKEIVKGLAETNIIEDARVSAARQLIPIATQLGFKEENVTITFRKDLTAKDVPSLIRYLN